MVGAPERTAVLVIRAWLEKENEQKPLRARITSTLDASTAGATRSVGASSESEIVNAVRAWLWAFTEDP